MSIGGAKWKLCFLTAYILAGESADSLERRLFAISVENHICRIKYQRRKRCPEVHTVYSMRQCSFIKELLLTLIYTAYLIADIFQEPVCLCKNSSVNACNGKGLCVEMGSKTGRCEHALVTVHQSGSAFSTAPPQCLCTVCGRGCTMLAQVSPSPTHDYVLHLGSLI